MRACSVFTWRWGGGGGRKERKGGRERERGERERERGERGRVSRQVCKGWRGGREVKRERESE